MLKDRFELEKELDKQCDKIAFNNDLCKSLYLYANQTYDIPKGTVSDMITKRMSLSEATQFELFILLDSINTVLEKKSRINVFFSKDEIKLYQDSKYAVPEIEFPLEFKMVQINEDQWIGYINIQTLMKLRRAQIINYNKNAQRTMKRIVRGETESWQITVNQKNVREIRDSFLRGDFISNTITLTIPEDSDASFHYDEKRCVLSVNAIQQFDITDGFHRYVGACQASDMNPDFDYNMELRVFNISDDKARQFIFQEDQKTRMSKVDSDSFNMNNAANIVATRLNENVMFNLKGQINRNDGLIDFGELSSLVNYFYFKQFLSKQKERVAIVNAVKELTNNFNALTEYNTKYLDDKMSYPVLLSAMFCFNYFKDNEDKIKMCEVIEKTAREIQNSDNKKFKNKTPRKILMDEVKKIVEEVQ